MVQRKPNKKIRYLFHNFLLPKTKMIPGSIHTFWCKGSAGNKGKITSSKNGFYLSKMTAQIRRLFFWEKLVFSFWELRLCRYDRILYTQHIILDIWFIKRHILISRISNRSYMNHYIALAVVPSCGLPIPRTLWMKTIANWQDCDTFASWNEWASMPRATAPWCVHVGWKWPVGTLLHTQHSTGHIKSPEKECTIQTQTHDIWYGQ